MVPLVEEAVEEARAASSDEVTMKANPEVPRFAHLRRLSGTKRWMVLADGLVVRASRMPDGFGVASTDQDHNAGKYAFRWPLGVFTIRGEPHEGEDEGKYLQEQLKDVAEQAPLSSDVDVFADIRAYVSAPSDGPVKLIATHTTFPQPMVILLDEIDINSETVAAMASSPPMPEPRVSSALTEDADAGDTRSP